MAAIWCTFIFSSLKPNVKLVGFFIKCINQELIIDKSILKQNGHLYSILNDENSDFTKNCDYEKSQFDI